VLPSGEIEQVQDLNGWFWFWTHSRLATMVEQVEL